MSEPMTSTAAGFTPRALQMPSFGQFRTMRIPCRASCSA
jgi:hypothetical protein